ncbi:hypothetical protein ACH4HG_11195 [Streptomyces coeruleorubidus]|uniref:HEAT repeat domain-containing protein n=1 Tax=Streptomyces coeruleorubidus TaxID=116188 RepID=A0ABZ0KDD2_STRC4|nr:MULTISPECIES: hypothetical protein [Streptomyces]WOT35855.1 hypothetical protein R5U08_17755 [Streptomyces coeruleorubidus]
MSRDSKKLAAASLGVLVVVAVLPAVLLLSPVSFGGGNTSRLTAVLTFIGVLVTASVSLIGLMLNSQTERRLAQEHADQQRQLKLDAAMRAGQLISPTELGSAHPAAMASGLLALTKLDYADLAVALLVDLWAEEGEEEQKRISDETAILVIDAALRSTSPNAQLVAAELLCRHAANLSVSQSLHWPSAVDGSWNPTFRPKTKLLIVEALVRMAAASEPNEGALRSVAVRLYGIWREEPKASVRGCIGKLIKVVFDRLCQFRHKELVHGIQMVPLSDLERAAESAAENPDSYLNDLSDNLANRLKEWAPTCQGQPITPGALATAAG